MSKSIAKAYAMTGKYLRNFGQKKIDFYYKHSVSTFEGFPEQHSPDFRPDLVQDYGNITNGFYSKYVNHEDYYRQYMPLRQLDPEVNTKYIAQMIEILQKKYISNLVRKYIILFLGSF